jgi:hypothetical protein
MVHEGNNMSDSTAILEHGNGRRQRSTAVRHAENSRCNSKMAAVATASAPLMSYLEQWEKYMTLYIRHKDPMNDRNVSCGISNQFSASLVSECSHRRRS